MIDGNNSGWKVIVKIEKMMDEHDSGWREWMETMVNGNDG